MRTYIKLLLSAIMCFALNFSFAQIDTKLHGEYDVVSGTDIQTLKISEDRVEAYIGENLVAHYFYFGREGDLYTLEDVKIGDTFDPSVNKDRIFLEISLSNVDTGNLLLNVRHMNGYLQEIEIKNN